ncbi:alpha/beta fold hydrolase [Zoogloea sp.]|uniref:alpha/beta fold hydrolase n=1 Tax=Zoogloea sp. TaxID=49181 RepID=UPI0025DEFB79|nr:alpha/beta fold hydrolase [Zoogloea sp.]MCK6395339.1 alpha/beta fold hydrolase [Zoogloea sp.]
MTRPIVLLHGWGLSSAVWAPLQHALDPALSVGAIDLPGHGSATPVGPRLEDWADAVLGQLPENCLVVGWSLGAQLALHLAHHHPARIDRLVLISATPRFVQADDWPAAMPAATLAEFRHSFNADPAGTQRRFIALQGLGDGRRRSVLNALGSAVTPADDAHRAALADGLGLLESTDLRNLVPEIRQPVRLLHGAVDTLMPAAAAEWLADTLPDGRLSVFSDTGHAPFLSRPLDCASLIEGFARD